MSHPQFEPSQQPKPDEPVYYAEPPKKSRGCFFYGCIAALIVSGLGFLLIIGVIGMGYYYFNKLIQDYTDTAPAAIPAVTASDDDRKAIQKRFDDFKKALEEGKEAELVLTADDVNVLIDNEPNIKGKVFCKIKGDEVTGEISIPLGETGIPGLKGRYLNGNATFTAEITEDGELDIRAHEIEVKGKKMPDEVKSSLAKENLAKEFLKDENNRKLIRKIRRIVVKDDKVYLKTRDLTKEHESEEAASKGSEPPKAEAAKDAPKAETPKAEPPKAEAPKAEAPKAEAPKGQARNASGANTERLAA